MEVTRSVSFRRSPFSSGLKGKIKIQQHENAGFSVEPHMRAIMPTQVPDVSTQHPHHPDRSDRSEMERLKGQSPVLSKTKSIRYAPANRQRYKNHYFETLFHSGHVLKLPT